MKLLKYLGLLGAILGYLFNVSQHYELSYWIWLISNSLWLYYNYRIKEWEMFIMFIIYDGFCLYGLIK